MRMIILIIQRVGARSFSCATKTQNFVSAAFVNDFWFGNPVIEGGREMWWKKDPGVDAEIKQKFLSSLEAAKQRQLDYWTTEPQSCLALRRPRAFEADKQALSIAAEAIQLKLDSKLLPIQRSFLYLPYEHSERKEDQETSVQLFTQLALDSGEQPAYSQALQFAKLHKEIIDRFGRFPHRNKILNRESTEEEKFFLTQPGSSF